MIDNNGTYKQIICKKSKWENDILSRIRDELIQQSFLKNRNINIKTRIADLRHCLLQKRPKSIHVKYNRYLTLHSTYFLINQTIHWELIYPKIP